MKRSSKNEPTSHPEAKGLLLLAGAFLLFLSLVSFVHKDPSQNLLGFLGYSFAWALNYFFGLGSFPLLLYLTWTGWKLIFYKQLPFLMTRSLFFLLFLSSLCVLLNLCADLFPHQASLFEKKVYTETVIFQNPHPHVHVRYNLGGVPFFFLYRDLPYCNLQTILSTPGVVLTFSMSCLISFLLFTGIPVSIQLQTFLRLLKMLGQKIFSLLQLPKKRDPLPVEAPLSQPKVSSKAKPFFQEQKPLVSDPSPSKDLLSIVKKPPLPEISLPLEDPLEEELSLKNQLGYSFPPLSLLSSPPKSNTTLLKKELQKKAEVLKATLQNFGIEAEIGEINCGPTITSIEILPAVGVKVQKIKSLENDIALNLQAKSIRILAPIPGKAAVGVEIPSPFPQTVKLKELLLHYHHQKKKLSIPLLLGKTVGGDYVLSDLARMPHCLIAGATGSGKSVCINTIVASLLMIAPPDEIKLLMIDPKKVELSQYSSLPHMVAPVITEAQGAYAALQWLVREMQLRYEILKQLGLRNVSSFNTRKINPELEQALSIPIPARMPFIVAIIDEFADLILASSSDLETPIARIAQMARAVGIHLILATQRPSREVITGIIKANIPCRIAFKVASRVNSQIILDDIGAESLLGNGDLLFLPPGSSQLIRAQGAFISDEEINSLITFIQRQSNPSYLVPSFDRIQREEDLEGGSRDKLYDQALLTVLESKIASTTFLQRKLKIGYARAASLMDELEQKGVIGPQEGSRPRRVLVSSPPRHDD